MGEEAGDMYLVSFSHALSELWKPKNSKCFVFIQNIYWINYLSIRFGSLRENTNMI